MDLSPVHLIASSLTGLAVLVLCVFIYFRLASENGQNSRDSKRLCSAIERIGTLEFGASELELESERLRDVQASFDRMLPELQNKVEQLEWRAEHDNLTNLLNATSFRRNCEQFLMPSGDHDRRCHLIYFDVNDFKKINDTLGHYAGDQVLVAIADRLRLVAMNFAESRLQEVTQPEGSPSAELTMARMGGDEFAIFIPGSIDEAGIERFVQRLQRLINEPCAVGVQTLRIRIAVGIAANSSTETSFDRLLASADSAMYAAKGDGGNTYRFFSEAMRSNADRLLEMEIELRNALRYDQFELYFQPQLNLRSGRIDTVEALIRWNHPERGLILPNEFIGFAESHGLIDEIGDWVISEAVKIASRWSRSGLDLKISINVSPKQLQRVELIALIRASLDYHKVAPDRIELEITEAAIMRDEGHSFERLESLRAEGVTVALDDFGTGYSNISQLMMLPMDRLKLDRSLIDFIALDQRKWVIASSMVRLARELGFMVVAEGVETVDQFELLQEAGCEFIQGYLIAHPLAEEELTHFVATCHFATKIKAVV